MGIVYNNKYEQIKHSEKEDNSLAQIYFSEAEELRYNKKFKEAIDKYLHSILINRNNYKTYIGLALAYKNLKEYNKAIKNLEKAEILQPDDINVQKELAICNIIKGDFENGIKHLIWNIYQPWSQMRHIASAFNSGNGMRRSVAEIPVTSTQVITQARCDISFKP